MENFTPHPLENKVPRDLCPSLPYIQSQLQSGISALCIPVPLNPKTSQK